ncbi:hypothetical protein ACIBK8_25845 [Streptomyces sp. NPDC050161]|uniref:hypothetical protein n=1 Tax=Streptomyces sp. NPDC050161 TaxID=3365604 RepID=UPI0037956F5E
MPSPSAPPKKVLTALDHRIEAAVDHSIDTLWEHHDRKVLDEPRSRLAEAHRLLVQAERSVTFYRTLLHRLASGEFPVDEALFARIDRTVDQLEEAAKARDEQQEKAVAVLEPVEAAAKTVRAGEGIELSAPDITALLAITQGAKLHEHLLTEVLSVSTASGTRIAYDRFQRFEEAGLVQRDTSHPVHAGQPVTLSESGRAALSASRRTRPAASPPPQPGAWPAPARPRH